MFCSYMNLEVKCFILRVPEVAEVGALSTYLGEGRGVVREKEGKRMLGLINIRPKIGVRSTNSRLRALQINRRNKLKL